MRPRDHPKIIALTIFLIIGLYGFSLSSVVNGATGVSKIIHFQGRLLDTSGNLIGGTTGTNYCFRFSIYTDATVGAPDTQLWPAGTPSSTTASVQNGIFNVGVGDTTAGGDALTYNFQDNDTVYLNVEVATLVGATCAAGDGAESYENVSPRQQIVSSGYAINASTVLGLVPYEYASSTEIPVLSGGNLNLGGANPQINATGSQALVFQGNGGTGDVRFFSASNTISSTGVLTLAGTITSTGLTINTLTPGSLLFAGASGAVSQSSTVLYWDNVNGRLGVGNNSPSSTLHITGTGRFSSALTLDNGLTLTTGALTLTSTSGSVGLTLSSSTTAFNVNGLFDIDTTNDRVGIATTSPSTTLHVIGTGRFSGDLTLDSGLVIGGDTINDFTGFGLAVNSNKLDVATSTAFTWTGAHTFGASTTLSNLVNNQLLYLDPAKGIAGFASSTAGKVLMATGTAPYFSWETDATGITSLGGLTGAAQTFATSTGISITSSGSTHTFGVATSTAFTWTGIHTFQASTTLSNLANNGLLYIDAAKNIAAFASSTAGRILMATGTAPYFSFEADTSLKSLGGLTAATQTFAADTGVSISSSVSTHTFGVATSTNFTWTGAHTFSPATASTTAFQVKSSSSLPVLSVDTIVNRIGVNTNSPSTTLDVVGGGRFNATSTTAFQIQSSSTGLTFDSVNNRLGIGTATPSTALDVNGTVTATSLNASSATVSGLTQGSIHFTASGGAISESSTVLYWDNVNGRLGIGNNSPSSTLHITGTGRFSSTLTLDNGLTLTTGALTLTSTSGSVGLTLSSSTTAFNVNNQLVVDTTNNRVGIGTTAPSTTLDVRGNIALTGGSDIRPLTDSTNALKIADANNGKPFAFFDSTNGRLGLGFSAISPSSTLHVSGTALFKTGTDSVTAFQFQPSSSTTPILNIDSLNARVGIGTNAASATLHIINPAVNNVAILVKAAASQAANLTNWTDSSNNVMVSIEKQGGVIIGDPTITTSGAKGRLGVAEILLKGTAASGKNINIAGIQTSAGDYSPIIAQPTVNAATGTNLAGFTLTATIGTSSSYTNFYGVKINNPAKTGSPVGTLTNNYGLFVAALTSGSTLNYALWTDGTTPSYFGGPVGLGAISPSSTLHVSGTAIFASNASSTAFQIRSSSTTPIFSVDSITGKIGIGNNTPSSTLHITGVAGTVSLEVNSNETTATNNVLMLRSDVASADDPVFRVQANGATFADGAYTGTGADYAEWFVKEDAVQPRDVIGLNPDTGKVRRYRKGDLLVGIYSEKPGFVGNQPTEKSNEEMAPDHALVSLVGQVRVAPEQVQIRNGVVYTKDNVQLGYLLLSGKVLLTIKGETANSAFELRKEDAHNELQLTLNDNDKLVIKNGSSTETVISLDGAGNAFFAGEIKAGSISANKISGLEIITDKISLLSTEIKDIATAQSSTISTQELAVHGSASILGSLKALKIISNEIESPTLIVLRDGLAELASSTEGIKLEMSSTTEKINQLATNLGELDKRLTTIEIGKDKGTELDGVVLLKGGLQVSKISAADDEIAFMNDIVFFGRPYFTTDTAGFGVILQGQKEVKITFEKEYIEKPVVNASISFDESAGLNIEEMVLNGDLRYLVTRVNNRGFTILLNRSAPTDIQFSWTALAVKNPTTFFSLKETEPSSIQPEEPTTPTSSEVSPENNSSTLREATPSSTEPVESNSQTQTEAIPSSTESNTEPVIAPAQLSDETSPPPAEETPSAAEIPPPSSSETSPLTSETAGG